jgi:hypothetical protein
MVEGSIKTTGHRYEEAYSGHLIFIEPNRDPYREGVEWSVCMDDVEIESGLEFSDEAALDAARKCVDAIRS